MDNRIDSILVSKVAPDMVRSVQGEISDCRQANGSLAARNPLTRQSWDFPPALSPPTAMYRAG